MRISVLHGLLLMSAMLCLSAQAQDLQHSADVDQVMAQRQVSGVIVLFDEQHDKWVTNDTQRANTGYIPASTFKVPHSLLLLEAGVVKDQHSPFPWTGEKHSYASWNQDHSFATALRYSVVPIYQALAKELGSQRMADGVKLLEYGNMDISGAIDSFWLEGQLAISAVQQVEFMHSLYHQNLPVSQRSQKIVKQMMLLPANNPGQWFGKTGYGVSSSPGIGWFVGWYQQNQRVIFFALNMDISDPHLLPLRQKLVKQAIKAHLSQ
ncbi:class D beta-lactamase [Shewanella waksmanii]|uniref:class D beta-lactamase n=1 Tax=Shewanella waksmanii TaxID=213783 RepID=UPI00048D71E8|nr:class D beta-lactamase [Shewanella waksmanii]